MRELFFSLDRKERKDQGCKSLAKHFIRNAMEIKLLSRNNYSVLVSGYFEQKFPFNAFLIHSFNAKYLRPIKQKLMNEKIYIWFLDGSTILTAGSARSDLSINSR